MSLSFLLLLLVPVAAVFYVMWDYKRKTAQRDVVSAERLSELLGVAKQAKEGDSTVAAVVAPLSAAPAASSTAPAAAVVAASPPAAAAPAAAPRPAPTPSPPVDEVPAAGLYARRERMLNPPQTLLYHLLKVGLPDHLVFARVTLASLLEAGPGLSGVTRDEQTRRLGTLTVDFALADRNMRPVAVVELAVADASSVAQTDRSTARTRLAAAGVRYVELDAKALPRKEGIRAAVLGDAPSAKAPAGAAGVR